MFKSSAGNAPTTAAIALQLYALRVYEQWLGVLTEAGAPGIQDLPMRAEEIDKPHHVSDLMNALRHAFEHDPELRQRIQRTVEQSETFQREADVPQLITALAALYAGSGHRYLNLYGPPGTIRTIPYHALVGKNGQDGASSLVDLSGTVVFVDAFGSLRSGRTRPHSK